ncbi:MAG: ATP-binding cassette domain-containing protein [Desulfovibrio sp.]|jgi:zinc transport system ATP-binding protein|nr:ATP-binding cassette domain-containing protein [Desulfovibrio sp.]
MSSALSPALEIADLSFSHSGREPVLEDVTLDMRTGEFLALIGPNGGGKSTLLRLIVGLLRPCSGTLTVFGKAPGQASANIGYVPQFSGLSPDFPATVLEMTLMGAAEPCARGGIWGRDRRARDRAHAYLEILGLTGLAGQSLSSLSGGQRRRAMVARALMGGPENFLLHPDSTSPEFPFLLLLDEPTAGVDAEGTFCFYEFLGKLRGGISIIVVSHDLFMVSPFFDRVAFVNRRLTPLSGPSLTQDALAALFGRHMHACPVADMQHALGGRHLSGCSHPACAAGLQTHNPEAAAGGGPGSALGRVDGEVAG